MVQTECMYDVRFTWMSRRSMLYVHQCIKGFKFVLPSFVNSYCRRRSKQDIINTVGTMGLKGLETSWNNSTAKVHEGTDEVLEGTAQEYESTAGANLSTAEVYESTAHSLFKISVKGKLSTKEDFVSFREMITSQLQGSFGFYDEVRYTTLFVLSSSNRGRLLGIIDLMRQKNKRMKQEGLNRQIGILQKMEFDYKLMIGKLQDVT
ncbi:hypothetical protein Tco_0996167 [Tanacetum coccineum]